MRFTYFNLAAVLLGAILLASCAAPGKVRPQAVPAPAAPRATYPEDLQGAQLYRIDPVASSLHILVYRGGSMANMGHNHVISSKSLDGYIWRHTALDRSGFNIVVRVNELIVDDDNARAAQGDDFPLNLNDEAKRGTRSNMLSEAILNGAQYPVIAIRSIAIRGATEAPEVTAQLQIKSQTREVTVPVTMEVQGDRLQVKGEFNVSQSEFGITPYSVAMGALTVLDVVTIRFNLVALQVQP